MFTDEWIASHIVILSPRSGGSNNVSLYLKQLSCQFQVTYYYHFLLLLPLCPLHLLKFQDCGYRIGQLTLICSAVESSSFQASCNNGIQGRISQPLSSFRDFQAPHMENRYPFIVPISSSHIRILPFPKISGLI